MPGMFDWTSHQARGLQDWGRRRPWRVLPVPDSGPGRQSLELLWRVEQGLRALRLPVAVVEGLGDMRPVDALSGHQAIINQCLTGVPEGSVVLLHAPLDALTVVLADSEARPLVALDHSAPALVWAYNAVKVLLQAGGLQPVVLDLQEDLASAGDAKVASLTESLCTTCRDRLGWVPAVWPLGYDASASGGSDGGASLAQWLKLLDSALILEESQSRAHDELCSQRCPTRADQTIGVPDVHPQRHA